MSISVASILLIALRLSAVLAVPNVTVVPLRTDDCVDWPNWLPVRGSDITGGFDIQVDQCDDEGLEGLLTTTIAFNWTDAGGDSGERLVIDLRKSRRFARSYYRCWNGTVGYGPNLDSTITIAKDPRNAFLTAKNAIEGYKLEPYAHEINGTRQPGVFLGTMNRTTWGFAYVQPTECGQKDYYQAMLQGLPVDPDTEPRAANDPEFFGFLKALEI